MKSERRHELETNSLVQVMENLPLYLRYYASHIITFLLIVSAVFLLVRWRNHSRMRHDAELSSALAAARGNVVALRRLESGSVNEEAVAQRQSLLAEVNGNVDAALREASESEGFARAEALLARGDAHFYVANAPEHPGATTRPSLKVDRQAMLDAARAAYEAVVSTYPSQTASVVTARFGLAAVAESAGQWDDAKAHYDAILAMNAPASLKEQARIRRELLEDLRRPRFTGVYPPAGPVEPAASAPTAPPTTSPATP
jgi:tetratricopeptide (TPR) repeat protein